MHNIPKLFNFSNLLYAHLPASVVSPYTTGYTGRLPAGQVASNWYIIACQALSTCSAEIVLLLRRGGEREKHYISSSHLGLIRCLTPFRVRISTIASI